MLHFKDNENLFLYVYIQYYVCVIFVIHTAYFVVCMYVRIHISNMYLILVIVPPMTAPNLTEPTNLMNVSFTIKWTVTNSSNIYSYIITWTNLRAGDMDNTTASQDTTSYIVSGLNGVDNYNVSVAAYNKCGMMESGSITVYGK